jgi:peptidoglycan hydrolase CwlO-like protein
MEPAILIAIITSITAVLTAFIQYVLGRGTRKDLAEVKEQVVNDHSTADYPNTREELTSSRLTVEEVNGKVDSLDGKVDDVIQGVRNLATSVARLVDRIEGADANVESLEDTLSNRDKNNEMALARSIRQHEGDIKRVDADIAEIKALITQHPGTCAGFAPRTTYETPRETFFKPEE